MKTTIKWIKTAHKGLRYYEHVTRKHGKKKDRYYSVRFKVDGKDYTYGIGWWSEGVPDEAKRIDLNMTFEEYCLSQMKLYKVNVKAGEGPKSPKEKRKVAAEKEAQAKAEQAERERDSLIFSEIFKDWYYPEAQANKAKTSSAREEQLFRLWAEPAIGHLTLKQIAESDLSLQAVRKRMLEGSRANDQLKANNRTAKQEKTKTRKASARSIHYCFAMIRQVFNYARNSGFYSGENPVKGLKERKTDNKRFRFLSHEEAEQLLEALQLRSQDAHDMSLLSLDCGLRAGEVFKLTWGDINVEKGLMVLRDTKSGKTRFAYMTGRIKEMLSGREEGSRDQLVFPGRKDKRAVRISATFEKTVKDLGLNQGVTDPRQKVVFHTLRHTYASWLVQNGVNLYTVQKLLGHSTISQTERYSHLAPSTLQEAVKVLEKSIEDAKSRQMIGSEHM